MSATELADQHTRAELDDMATAAGIDGAASLPNKEAVAEAIVAAGGDVQAEDAPAGDTEAPTTESSGLPEGWQIVQVGPDYFSAERYVESLGLQKVSEGAETLDDLVAKCEAYDAHQAGLGEGWPNTNLAPAPVEAPVVEEEVPA